MIWIWEYVNVAFCLLFTWSRFGFWCKRVRFPSFAYLILNWVYKLQFPSVVHMILNWVFKLQFPSVVHMILIWLYKLQFPLLFIWSWFKCMPWDGSFLSAGQVKTNWVALTLLTLVLAEKCKWRFFSYTLESTINSTFPLNPTRKSALLG